MPVRKKAARKKPGPKTKRSIIGAAVTKKATATKRRRTSVAAVPGARPGRKPGRKRGRPVTGRAKKPFSIVLDPVELKALKDIAKKKNTSVAGLIRGAMNAVIFQANPKLARSALERDVDDFLDGLKGKLPMRNRFDGRKKKLRKNLVNDIISDMETL